MSTLDDDIKAAEIAVGAVLSQARLDMIATATGAGGDTAKLAAITNICKKIVPFISRPFGPAATQNDTNYVLWPKHPNNGVNVAVLRAAFANGNSQHEQVRLVVRQALSWEFNKAIDPAELLR